MTQLQVVKKIIRKRGYLVLWQAHWHSKFSVDELVPVAGGEGFNLGKPLKVIRQTSERDFLTQQQLSRRIERAHWKDWSATAQLRKMKKEAAPITFWRVKPTTSKRSSSGTGPIPRVKVRRVKA